MASIAFAGNYAGTVVSMPLSGILANTLGWESIFYIFGAIGIVWFVAWTIIVRKSPEDDPFISDEEKTYIVHKLGNQKPNQVLSVPWKDIFTSAAVWAVVASHFSENWGFYTLLTQLPTFLNGKHENFSNQIFLKQKSIFRCFGFPSREDWIHVSCSLLNDGNSSRSFWIPR